MTRQTSFPTYDTADKMLLAIISRNATGLMTSKGFYSLVTPRCLVQRPASLVNYWMPWVASPRKAVWYRMYSTNQAVILSVSMSTISGVRGSRGDSVKVWKPLVRRKIELKSNVTIYEGPLLPVAQYRVQWYPTLPLAAHRLIG